MAARSSGRAAVRGEEAMLGRRLVWQLADEGRRRKAPLPRSTVNVMPGDASSRDAERLGMLLRRLVESKAAAAAALLEGPSASAGRSVALPAYGASSWRWALSMAIGQPRGGP